MKPLVTGLVFVLIELTMTAYADCQETSSGLERDGSTGVFVEPQAMRFTLPSMPSGWWQLRFYSQ